MTVPLRYSVQSVSEAERRLGLRLSEIVVQIESEEGMGLRTLAILLAAGLPPSGPKTLVDMAAAEWFEMSLRRAHALIINHGIAECATAIGPPFGAFLSTIK